MDKEKIFKQEEQTLSEYVEDVKGYVNKEFGDIKEIEQEYQELMKEVAEETHQDSRIEILGIAKKMLNRRGYRRKLDYAHYINEVIPSPYFARLDITDKHHNIKDTLYIGKLGFPGHEKKKVIIDWRSPIASLYYNYPYATNKAYYETIPINAMDTAKEIDCSIDIRRTLEIEHSTLINVYDDSFLENIDKTDKFLISKLESKSGGKLEDIIETIQEDQNKILRYSPFKNIIVQGVAGSGKTTIAIHRISYIFYNYKNQINPAETLFITTSQVLINYLAKALPELDIHNIKKAALIDLLAEIIEKNNIKIKTKLTKTSEINSHNLVKNPDTVILQLNKYIETLDKHIKERFLNEIAKKISVSFYNIESPIDRFSHKPFIYIILYIQEDLKETLDELKRELRYSRKYGNSDIYERKIEQTQEVLSKIKEFLKTIKYEDLFHKFLNDHKYSIPKEYDLNYLSTLYYIIYKLGGLYDIPNYSLVILDEAQDLNKINYYCVKSLSTKNCFNFFGDLNQSVAKKTAIKDWDEIYDIFEEEESTKFNLLISYRSTQEIINFAAETLQSHGINTNIPISVSRHGDPIVFKDFLNIKESYEEAAKEICEIRKNEHKAIGIITNTDTNMELLSNTLSAYKIEYEKVNEKFEDFKKDGVFIIPLNLVKGLEFDTVFLLNFNAPELNDPIEGPFKKFVSISRAMNKLFVYKVSL